jgi:hypothetical protein
VWEFDATAYGQVPDRDIAPASGLDDARLVEACDAGERGDWGVADQLLTDIGDDWDLRYLYIANISACTHDGVERLGAWAAADPKSANAATLYASALAALSSGLGKGTKDLYRIVSEADAAAVKAAELAPDDPTPWAIRIYAAKGLRRPNDELRSQFAEAVRRAPLHRRAHTHAYFYWHVDWCGSDELAAQFVREQAALAPNSGMAFELRILHMQDLWSRHLHAQRHVDDIDAFFRTGPGRPLVHEAVDAFWTGELPSAVGVDLADQNRLAWALYQAERYDEACEVWTAIGGAMTTGYPWEPYASKRDAFQDLRKRSFANSSRQPASW